MSWLELKEEKQKKKKTHTALYSVGVQENE
jgi:hypothetical protein